MFIRHKIRNIFSCFLFSFSLFLSARRRCYAIGRVFAMAFCLCQYTACVCVCLSVCLTHANIVTKNPWRAECTNIEWTNSSSKKVCTDRQVPKSVREFQTASPKAPTFDLFWVEQCATWILGYLSVAAADLAWLIELKFNAPLDTELVFSETLFPANLLASIGLVYCWSSCKRILSVSDLSVTYPLSVNTSTPFIPLCFTLSLEPAAVSLRQRRWPTSLCISMTDLLVCVTSRHENNT